MGRWAGSLLALAGAVASLLALRALDYSRAELEFVAPADVEAAGPLAQIGELSWDPAPYQAARSLDPYRAFVRTECPQATDRALVACIVATMAARFPHGDPSIELFDRDYDPARALALHLAGSPGHCVTRSGLAATALLAVGVPARVVQLYPKSASGHNVFSYYDRQDERRYVVDPTYGVRVHRDGGRTIASLLGRIDQAVFDRVAPRPAGVVDDPEVLYRSASLLDGAALYPEPWLYTRVGERVARFPFTAHYVVVGSPTLSLGWGQRALWIASIALASLALVLAAASIRTERRATARDRSAAHAAADAGE